MKLKRHLVVAKHKIEILGKEYPSIASAANDLHVSKSALYRLVKNEPTITLSALKSLKKGFGKKVFSLPIEIGGKQYASVSSAAIELELSKTSLLKAVKKHGYTGEQLSDAVEELQQNIRGSFKKSL